MSDYDTDDAYEDYLFDSENLFECGEQSLTRYNIVLCELYNSKIHGSLENSSKEENIGFLVCCRFKKLDIEFIEDIVSEMAGAYNLSIRNSNHNIYRNYRNIISRPNYFKPEIAQCVYLESLHCVAILKTFWIKLVQRTWKRVFTERKRVITERCSVKSLRHREINGKWPNTCNYLPSFKGMLL
jgi:hypothetical protein